MAAAHMGLGSASAVPTEYLNYRDYGVKGDGVSDETTALQAMFNAAGTTGRPVGLPNAPCIITAPLVAPAVDGFHLFGWGQNSVIRVADTGFAWSNTNLGALTIPGNSTTTNLHDFRIYGGNTNRDSQLTGVGGNGYAGLAFSAQWGNVRNVEVFGFSASGFGALNIAGILLNGSLLSNFTGCRFFQNGQNIRFANTNDRLNFYGCQTQSSGFLVPNAINNTAWYGTATRILFDGCLFDENVNAAGNPADHRFNNGATARGVVYRNCTLYIFSGCAGLGLEGAGQSVKLIDCDLIPYGGNTNCTGISIASGSSVELIDSTVTGNGTGKCVTGSGTLYRGGPYNSLTGTVDVSTNTLLY